MYHNAALANIHGFLLSRLRAGLVMVSANVTDRFLIRLDLKLVTVFVSRKYLKELQIRWCST